MLGQLPSDLPFVVLPKRTASHVDGDAARKMFRTSAAPVASEEFIPPARTYMGYGYG